MEKEYKNTGYFLLILWAFVIFGFYKPYFALFPRFDRTFNTVVHIHAVALILWVILLFVQPMLVRYKKYAAHRLFGKFSYFLVPLIIISSIAVMNKQFNEGIEQKKAYAENLKALFIPFCELMLFSIFYVLAIINIRRNKVAFHMRYIICAALVFVIPSLARVTGWWFNMEQFYSYLISFILIDVILVALIFFDRQKNLNFKPFIIGMILFLGFNIGWFLLGHPF